MTFLRFLLYPLSVLYDLVTRARNHMYNIGYWRSFEFEVPTISVGNLTVGGTGKTPMIEYLIRLLKDQTNVVTLSRGYGRKTRGFRMAGDMDDASTIGDEPYQIFNKFRQQIHVAVAEERAVAIPFILVGLEGTGVILLDDAYQHRTVKPGLNILLTDYNRPFYKDYILPAGMLRESRECAGRADLIVVTKCHGALDVAEEKEILEEIRKYNPDAPVFFKGIRYGEPQPILTDGAPGNKVIGFCGIAKPKTFEHYLSHKYDMQKLVTFNDHHRYNVQDISRLLGMADEGISLITTEKDMVKLIQPPLAELIKNGQVFYLPMETYFLKDRQLFDDLVLKSLAKQSA